MTIPVFVTTETKRSLPDDGFGLLDTKNPWPNYVHVGKHSQKSCIRTNVLLTFDPASGPRFGLPTTKIHV